MQQIKESINKMVDEEFNQMLANYEPREVKGDKNNKLNIQDLDKLKVTKVKDWAIYFDYDGEKYLLHEEYESSDEDGELVLYKRNLLNTDGKYKLDYLYSIPYVGVPHVIYNNRTKYGGTLSQINKRDLVWKLTWKRIVDSLYSGDVHKRREEIRRIENLKIKLSVKMVHLKSFNNMDK